MRRPFIRVIKIGGSLFDRPDLPAQLEAWLAAQSPGWNILLAGGGRLADEIRRLDSLYNLDEDSSHWLCVDILRATANLLADLLPECPLLRSWDILQEHVRESSTQSVVFDPCDFLHHNEHRLPGLKLPRTWQATSDSIAARLANVIEADELVMFKATQEISDGMPLEVMVARGIVDSFLPKLRVDRPAIRFITPKSDV